MPSKNSKKRHNNSVDKVIDPMEVEIANAESRSRIVNNVRHFFYGISKFFVKGVRSLFSRKIRPDEEKLIAGGKRLFKSKESNLSGGTKKQVEYEDSDRNHWISKEAVNCMGYYKLTGVLLTVDGAKIQTLVDKETAIPAYQGKTMENGDVSFQLKLKRLPDSELDLFKFSKYPYLANPEVTLKVQELGDQILREHITDWLLCNFDTKGENFILTRNNEGKMILHGIDKEAAFNHLKDPAAAHMSMTYHPHSNNTLYNAVFELYTKGKMDLNLDVMQKKVNEIVSMDDDKYMENFRNYLAYEREKHPETYAKTYLQILERKQHLGDEYNRFFGDLVNERIKNLGENSPEAASLKNMYHMTDGKLTLFKSSAQKDALKCENWLTAYREKSFAYACHKPTFMKGIAQLKLIDQMMQDAAKLKQENRLSKEAMLNLYPPERRLNMYKGYLDSPETRQTAEMLKDSRGKYGIVNSAEFTAHIKSTERALANKNRSLNAHAKAVENEVPSGPRF